MRGISEATPCYPLIPISADGTRKTKMELCDVCSQIDPTRHLAHEQVLGSCDEVLLKSRRPGPHRGGCGCCAFFCAALRRSKHKKYDNMGVQLSDFVNICYYGSTLYARIAKPKGRPEYDTDECNVDFDVCTEGSKGG